MSLTQPAGTPYKDLQRGTIEAGWAALKPPGSKTHGGSEFGGGIWPGPAREGEPKESLLGLEGERRENPERENPAREGGRTRPRREHPIL